MKNLKFIALLLGMMAFIPAQALASADDFDNVTVEAIELDNHSSDSLTHEVEIPDQQEMDDHHSDVNHQEMEHEQEQENEQETEQENEIEDSATDSQDDGK